MVTKVIVGSDHGTGPKLAARRGSLVGSWARKKATQSDLERLSLRNGRRRTSASVAPALPRAAGELAIPDPIMAESTALSRFGASLTFTMLKSHLAVRGALPQRSLPNSFEPTMLVSYMPLSSERESRALLFLC